MTDFSKVTWNDSPEEDVSYSRLSLWAILAFLFGLGSFLAFFSLWFCFIGAIGIPVALAAIFLIRRSEGSLTGLRFAQSGLSLSIISLVAVSVLWPTYQYGIRREADRFFRIWFQAMRDDNIPLAKGLASSYWRRPSVDDPEKWWSDHYSEKFAHRGIHLYVEDKLVRVMLALGDRATVTYYKTLSIATGDEKDTAVMLYAVTYPAADGKTETFFVKMTGERVFPTGDVKSAGWNLTKNPEFTLPGAFQ